jgi:DNA-binding NarL/FixJ family response regulator
MTGTMEINDRVRVGVVAGDPLRRVGLQTILEESAGVRSEELDLEQAMEAEGLGAVLLDSSCVGSLPDALARFRRERPGLRVVVVGESLDYGHIQAVIGAGAKGYLAGTANEAEIRLAMEVVLDGSVWAPRKVLARLIEAGGVAGLPGDEPERICELMTRRESDVLRLLMRGFGNRQIGEAMGIDPVTVKAHLGRMLRKAGVKSRVELTLMAVEELRGEGGGVG